MDQTEIHEGESIQLSITELARIISEILTQVFDELSLQHSLEGIAVLPAGDFTYLIDIVIRNCFTDKLHGFAITIPATEEKGVIQSGPTKKFEVLTISREYLQSIGMHPKQVARLTDEDMARIAEMLVANLFDSEFDEEARFTARLVLAQKRKDEE